MQAVSAAVALNLILTLSLYIRCRNATFGSSNERNLVSARSADVLLIVHGAGKLTYARAINRMLACPPICLPCACLPVVCLQRMCRLPRVHRSGVSDRCLSPPA